MYAVPAAYTSATAEGLFAGGVQIGNEEHVKKSLSAEYQKQSQLCVHVCVLPSVS